MTTSQVIKILRELYPHRRFVLSNFTLWIKMGIAKPCKIKPYKNHPAYEWSAADVAALAAHIYLKDLGLDYSHHGDILNTLTTNAGSIYVIRLPRLTIKLDLSGFLDDVTCIMEKNWSKKENEHRN